MTLLYAGGGFEENISEYIVRGTDTFKEGNSVIVVLISLLKKGSTLKKCSPFWKDIEVQEDNTK